MNKAHCEGPVNTLNCVFSCRYTVCVCGLCSAFTDIQRWASPLSVSDALMLLLSKEHLLSLCAVSWGPCVCVCRPWPSSVSLCTEGQRVSVCVRNGGEGVSEALWLAGAPPALLRWGISQDYLFSFPRLLFPVSPSHDSARSSFYSSYTLDFFLSFPFFPRLLSFPGIMDLLRRQTGRPLGWR